MFTEALLCDGHGDPIVLGHRARSRDWDEIRSFSNDVYMPFSVRPVGRCGPPDAVMRSAKVGRMILSRFRYGVPVHLWDFDPGAGNILVYTTLRQPIRHGLGPRDTVITDSGWSFVVDCTRPGFYWNEGDRGHLNLNLTVSHQAMEDICLKWFGGAPESLWRARINFGGPGSPWHALLEYVVRSIGVAPDKVACGPLGAHLEQAIAVELLKSWAEGAGIDLGRNQSGAAPYYVRRAEEYMAANAINLPTMTEVAEAAGVSVRALSGGFQRFRNSTPSAFLREQRLQGARQDLISGGKSVTVASVASRWGYVNFSLFARSYQKMFGELPSQTQGSVRS